MNEAKITITMSNNEKGYSDISIDYENPISQIQALQVLTCLSRDFATQLGTTEEMLLSAVKLATDEEVFAKLMNNES